MPEVSFSPGQISAASGAAQLVQVAVTEVEEIFFNPSAETVEGIYSFRTPDAFSCDVLRGDPENDLFLINHWISDPLPNRSQAEVVNEAGERERLTGCYLISAQGARGLARGQIFDLQGRLVASSAQEGMIRVLADKTDGG